MILTGACDGTARLWRAPDGRPLGPPLRHPPRIYDHAVAFSPDGRLALTGSTDKTARMWAVPSGKPVGEPIRHDGQVLGVAFSPDGRTILTGSDDRTVRIWDASTRSPLGAPIPQPDAVNAMAVSPDGKTFVAAYGLGAVQLWDVAARKPRGEPFPHPGSVETVAFSPDGQSVLTGCEDRMVRLWDVASASLRLPPLATGSWIWGVEFSPDGELVAAGNSDSVFLWDAATGQQIGPSLRHSESVNDLAFSPDGKTLLTICIDGKMRLFTRAPPVPDNLDRVANWVEVVTATALDPGRGSIHVLDNSAWQATRERLAQLGGPPLPAKADCGPESGSAGIALALAQIRSAKAKEHFAAALDASRGARPDESIALFRRGLAIADRLAIAFPGDLTYRRMRAMARNNFAWLLATYPDAKVQNPAHAVTLAREAVRLEPQAGIYWNTLGSACYRAGDSRGAIQALSKSNELDAKSALGFNAYFLAMAHRRLGEAGRARTWFDIARTWHRRRASADPELKRFRAEAAALLGLSDNPDLNEAREPVDDATLARMVLRVDPSASWARTWLGNSTRRFLQFAEPPAASAMPNGRRAFARP